MDTLEQQQSIHRIILNELIASTPEHWSNIKYVITCEWEPDRLMRIAHEISNPEGHKDIIEPSVELLQAVQALVRIFESAGHRLKRMSAVARSDSDQKWRLEVEHEYLD